MRHADILVDGGKRYCAKENLMGDEPVEKKEEQPKKNRKQRRAEKSKKGGDSKDSKGGRKIGPSQGAPKPRARRRQ